MGTGQLVVARELEEVGADRVEAVRSRRRITLAEGVQEGEARLALSVRC